MKLYQKSLKSYQILIFLIKIIINSFSENIEKDKLMTKIINEFDKNLKDIEENSNIQIITKNKNNQEILELLDELIKDHLDQSNLKKIESLEQKLINNLDEKSYSELIELKSQLNRE